MKTGKHTEYFVCLAVRSWSGRPLAFYVGLGNKKKEVPVERPEDLLISKPMDKRLVGWKMRRPAEQKLEQVREMYRSATIFEMEVDDGI